MLKVVTNYKWQKCCMLYILYVNATINRDQSVDCVLHHISLLLLHCSDFPSNTTIWRYSCVPSQPVPCPMGLPYLVQEKDISCALILAPCSGKGAKIIKT